MLPDLAGFRQAHVVRLTRPALVGPPRRVIVSVCLRPIVPVSGSAHLRVTAPQDRSVSLILAVIVVIFVLLLLPTSSVVSLPPSKMFSLLISIMAEAIADCESLLSKYGTIELASMAGTTGD
uniref:WGS project CBMI000000000 data, contig CS3069_c001077 n=1 Tax=Fusarium clavum TaxID=2594811 RepID=A0A090MB93_9HYPO|nr:unnamed protein product [Fusarium clavum]CEG05747.1 unnamed protein product [Fusarium clavum]